MPLTRSPNYEAHCRWIQKAIMEFDESYKVDMPSKKRAAMKDDLLSTIKIATDMELGHRNDEGPSYE